MLPVVQLNINNTPKLVQVMAWRRIGDKPFFETVIDYFSDSYMHHTASIGLVVAKPTRKASGYCFMRYVYCYDRNHI